MAIKVSILIYISLIILSVFVGCVTSNGDIDIIGSWQTDSVVFTVSNEEVTISDYARGTVIKYDNDNDYAIVYFDEHVSPSVNQKYVRLVWVNLTEISMTLHVYEPQDSPELAEAATSLFDTADFDKI
jgi:hypothetical protein